MSGRFAQAVTVHRILGESAQSVGSAEPSEYQRRFRRRLVERAHAVARSLADRSAPSPEPMDALDELIDQQLLSPARRAIVQRTVALERWLADHGFQGGRPIRFVRAHRPLGYHGESFQLSTARPVFRDDFSPADHSLTERLLDGIHGPVGGLGGVRRRPTLQQPGRISVIPGFMLLELPPAEFARQFSVELTSQVSRAIDTSEVGSDRFGINGHIAVGTSAAGPILVSSRDHTGEQLAHALFREYAHELAHLGEYHHRHSLAAPGQLIQSPSHFHGVADQFLDPSQLDQLAHQLLAERARHLAPECHAAWPLSLADLGFTAADWVPLAEPYPLNERFVAVAQTYLASLLLGRTLIAALNHHPEAFPLARYFPREAFADVACQEEWHPHYGAAHHYVNFIRAAQAGQLDGRALDDLYGRLIDPTMDFGSHHPTHHVVRLDAYPTPLHGQIES